MATADTAMVEAPPGETSASHDVPVIDKAANKDGGAPEPEPEPTTTRTVLTRENPDKVADGAKAAKDEDREREAWEAERRKIPLSVEVTWHDFERFKNRYSDDEGLAIIEVLRGHSQIQQEVIRETNAREAKRTKKGRKNTRAIEPLKGTDEDAGWIQRVRIQSPALLRLMSRLSGHADGWPIDKPRVFFQPFRSFHYYLPQMKECIQVIEARLAEVEANKTAVAISADESAPAQDSHLAPPPADASLDDVDNASDDGSVLDIFEEGPLDPSHAVSGDLVINPVALSHVRKYVEFAERYVEPRWKTAATTTTRRKFRFDELLMVYHENDLLYVPPASESSQRSEEENKATAKMSQRAWRCFGYAVSQIDDETPDDTAPAKDSQRVISIWAYYVDWDGTSYVPVRHHFDIVHYRGDKDVTGFPIYPMRFVKDADKIKATLREQGEWFQRAIKLKHLYCEGWSFTHGPTGATSEGSEETRTEHVEGEVIIDFAEGYKSEPSLGPGPSEWTKGLGTLSDSDWPHGTDSLSIRHWKRSENGQLKLVGEIVESSQMNEYFGAKRIENVLKVRAIPKAYEDKTTLTSIENDDDIILLPSRVVAYSFRERKFFMLAAKDLREIPPAEKDTFRDLKIENEHKWMVRSLVQNHLDKQVVQKSRPSVSLNQDIIRGKGSGLFILLHGVPGVGKTATAEAVAQANKKPLFIITCGDLGFTPREVENSLRDIFRLAHLWDCILLLDEADVFLSRREMGDLKRNALVSVFLRVLEYYSGILFLTTNRVGTLDEAFKSRIHVSLYYPPLTRGQTLAIFKVNIRKLREIEAEKQKVLSDTDPEQSATPTPQLIIDEDSILHFAGWQYDSHEQSREQRWNGRQIRNAFQIAHSLAYFESQEESREQEDADNEKDSDPASTSGVATLKPTSTTVLNYVQFKKVAKVIEKFEDYLYQATAATDMDRARKAHTRADDFNPRYSGRESTYTPRYQGPSASRQEYPDYPPPRRQAGGGGSGSWRGHQGRRPQYRPPGDEEYPETPPGRGTPQGRRRGGRSQGGDRSGGSPYLSPPSQEGSRSQGDVRGQNRRPPPVRSGGGERSFDRGAPRSRETDEEGLDEDFGGDEYEGYGRRSRGSYYGDEGEGGYDDEREYYQR